MKFNGEPYGLQRRGVATAVMLGFCAIATAIFVEELPDGGLGSSNEVASALAIGFLVGVVMSAWEARSAGRTLQRRVEYGRKLDRNSRRDFVLLMLFIITINIIDSDFDPLYLVGSYSALLVFTGYFIYDRWILLPRVIASGTNPVEIPTADHPMSGGNASDPSAKPELSDIEKDLRQRGVFVVLWLTIIAANLIAGVLSPRFTGGSSGEFGFGIFCGLFVGGIVMIAVLAGSSGSREDGRFIATTMPLLLVGAISIDDIFSDGPGPVSSTALMIAGCFGLAATIIDRWVALPRQMSGDPRRVLLVGDGGQDGLVHRGHVVAGWAMAICFSGVVVMLDALASGIAEDVLSAGLLAGVALGAFACAAIAWDARGSHAERVARTSHARTLPASRRVLQTFGALIAIIALLIVLSPGFATTMLCILVAAIIGLLATIVDRWIITPRRIDAEDGLAFS